MSETVHYKGTLVPVLISNGNLEETAKELYGDGPQLLPEYYDNYLDWLIESSEYYVNEDQTAIYEVNKEDVDVYDDIMRATKSNDEVIEFEVKYYNGGCSFEEALDISIVRMGK